MRALLLSAYAAGSHRYWRQGLREMLPDWRWQVEELAPRFFSWRIRGNPLHWAMSETPLVAENADILLATSMVDLATLRGLRPDLAALPSALYFHENQFDYPTGRAQHGLLEAQMVSLYSALAADRLLFNSAYNREGFLSGVARLLKGMPDLVPPGVAAALREKSRVLPVPLLPAQAPAGRSLWSGRDKQMPVRILWSGRFEYDKGGAQLFAALVRLEASGLDYQLALAGQRFRDLPEEFAQIEQDFKHRLVHFGYLQDIADYHSLLREADIVLSTALHEFQGIAVMEAVSMGCQPLLPDRQAYPELYPAHCLYPSHPEEPEKEAEGLVAALLELSARLHSGALSAPDVSGFSCANLAPRYRQELARLLP